MGENMEDTSNWIDISVPLKTGMVRYPGDPPVRVSPLSSGNREEPMVSRLSLCAHAGTHVDAPLHYIAEGKGVDQMPAAAMIGPARVIAITDTHVISVQELEREQLLEGERILLKTGNSALWESDCFAEDYIYLSTDAALFLVKKRIAMVGIDYLSVAGFKKNEAEVHRTLLEAGVWIIEGLNLKYVEPGWYDLVCLPLLLSGIEAAPARAMVRARTEGPKQRS